ncbi:hypothetical protein [Microbacterium sp. PAMC22086]|uniref:hypothetical protein n=1 Tax=Microbacterium sp. PAMC22086 TaxID=2861281 RepID=UPI001C62DBFD|nr:hypothetical protein [Microbacterium sp. PAMC22086]QYG12882.1 hypothetical protein KY497_06415 [Microbacterium sp. PAMC22086]
MTDEHWTEADDAKLAMHALPAEHPVALTVGVWNALDDVAQHAETLSFWVTPESRTQWGDFSALADGLSDETLSVVSTARQKKSAPDVAYVWLIREETGANPRMTHGPEDVTIAAVFTWIWRPELGGWRLHAVGDQMPAPEDLPRTSAGDAPAIGSVRVP